MIDNYSHNDIGVMYISENIPGPLEQSPESQELIKKFNSQLIHSCNCNNKCLPNRCKCLKLSGGANYTYIQHKTISKSIIINKKDNSLNTYPIVECNELCKCSDNCGNRLVQNGPMNALIVKSSQNKLKGLGLFTSTLILKGSFVSEYAGEVLTREQAQFRYHFNERHGKMNYIFCLNEHAVGKTVQTYIDPSCFGNIGRYINHSCEPNCELVPVRVNSPIPKLAVFSVSDIQPNTEITFSYGFDEKDSISDIVIARKQCFCYSSKCKGFMPYLPFLT